VQQFSRNQSADFQIINEHARQLLFIEALQQHPDLFKEENQWQVTQALLKFFDELSLNQNDLFHSAEDWQQQLEQAYGVEEQSFEHLQYESKLVYTLWHAWQQQLSENKLYDETADYISRLHFASTNISKDKYFICLEGSNYSKTEQAFIDKLVSKGQCQLIEFTKTLTTNTNSTDPFAAFLSETFTQSEIPIKQRAQDYADRYGGALSAQRPFSTYMAGNEEEQIRAIDYFVRSNILHGKRNIAIISEDRKLSRRLRALLERANIQLQDKAGWSLATTQAATIIERWLECIEQDFSAYPLLDCLKSPFIDIAQNNTGYMQNVYRFEHDLIFHENISSNISVYKKQLKKRLKRLTHWPQNAYNELIEILNHIEKSATALSALHASDKKLLLSDFLNTLLDSLENLGIAENYQKDDAGLILLKTFESLKQSLKYSDPTLSWQDCRIWLGMALESQNFTPPTNNTNVQLMTLEQAACLHFDCVIIAATESQHFPGSAKTSPFFNQAVRASLGLLTWETQREQRHELFNQVLLSSPEILLTACNEEKGEQKPVSPWLELLVSFYRLAFDDELENKRLHELVQSNSEVFTSDEKQLPATSRQALSILPDDLIPERISASSYQRLINCPYQYFSADGLRLKALEELSDELKKSDYGERIHLILQVFHNGHDRYGEAYKAEINTDKRRDAEDYLARISEKVFLADLDENVLHNSWLHRWKKHIPAYIDWQVQHQQQWRFYQSEKNLESKLDASLKIYGRLDRIDKNRDDDTHAIIDYKTGKTARQEDVDCGENVQLSTYALLDDEASHVSYLSVDSSQQKVESKACLNGDALQENRELNKKRLTELFKQMKNSEPLTAWGDDKVCAYCDFSGLCRKAEVGE
jgi:ATP-dependent helicase/nuclease subunit B